MLLGFVLLFAYAFVVWLVFFKFRWLKFSIAWGFFSTFFVLHLGIIFLIGLRYVAPASTEARIIQRTIQLTPRLSEPSLVTAVLVEPNVHVKRGTPLFQFDKRPYEYKARQLEAQLAKAKQDVLVLKADTAINAQKIAKYKAEVAYAKYQLQLSTQLAKSGAGPEEDVQKLGAKSPLWLAFPPISRPTRPSAAAVAPGRRVSSSVHQLHFRAAGQPLYFEG